jgi:hypothetical protein
LAKSEGKNGFRVPPQITQHFTINNTSDFDGITYMEPDPKIVTLRKWFVVICPIIPFGIVRSEQNNGIGIAKNDEKTSKNAASR